jgi:2''-5'' RNA ligase
MRAFIGIEFDRALKKSMIDIQNKIKENSIKGRWKYIDNFHLTLKFLGEVDEDVLFSIHKDMKYEIQNIDSFNLVTGGIDFFMGRESLRVVYLKVKDESNELNGVFNLVEECCINCGIPKEKRRYTPHITIAQDVVLKDSACNFKELNLYIPALKIPVREVSIIKSEQLDNKRVYTKILSVPLLGNN